VLDVVLGRPDADHELLRDFAVREPACDERQHLCLASRQPESLPFASDRVGDARLGARGGEIREGCPHVTRGRMQQVVRPAPSWPLPQPASEVADARPGGERDDGDHYARDRPELEDALLEALRGEWNTRPPGRLGRRLLADVERYLDFFATARS
jgi:hypothetical protein